MGFGRAVKHVFTNYANFRGRASRPEFWWFSLFLVIVYVVLNIISGVGIATSPDPQRWGPLAQVGIILTVASGFVGFILFGLSALQNSVLFTAGLLLGLASGIGSIFLLICALLPGTRGPNRYGPGPVSA